MMDIREILEILPHRYPFLLIDKVLELLPGERLLALKNVTFNEPFFNGHFPGAPVMPGVLMLEAAAQASALLVLKTREIQTGQKRKPNELIYFAGIDNARFKRPVFPGDQLMITAQMGREKRGIWMSHADISVGGELACSVDLIAAMKEVQL